MLHQSASSPSNVQRCAARTVETGKWPPHPSVSPRVCERIGLSHGLSLSMRSSCEGQDGNADLPAGPVPSIKAANIKLAVDSLNGMGEGVRSASDKGTAR